MTVHAHPAHPTHLHGHHGTPADGQQVSPTEFWEEFYSGEHPWSGKANEVLVDEMEAHPLAAGTVLDLGCGSGADVLWLAGLGWKATGADISVAALDLADVAAHAAGLDGQVEFEQTNLDEEFPEGSWDLVTASYLHSPVALGREGVLQRALDALNPGGVLIVISHLAAPAWRGETPVPFPSVEEVVASVTREGFTVVHADTRTFEVPSPEGEPGTKVDSVVRVRRDN